MISIAPFPSFARTRLETNANAMSSEPEETKAEKLERKDHVERVPEGTFGGTRERLREVKDDEAEAEDTGDQGHGQN
jgi:hypothetical protein